MVYTVIWKPKAENALAELWMKTTNRAAVTAAVSGIDQLLRTDPVNAGESRAEGMRLLLVPPLGANFSVDEEERRVHVAAVWEF